MHSGGGGAFQLLQPPCRQPPPPLSPPIGAHRPRTAGAAYHRAAEPGVKCRFPLAAGYTALQSANAACKEDLAGARESAGKWGCRSCFKRSAQPCRGR